MWIGFEKMFSRLDVLEASLNASLRESREGLMANTKELGILSDLVSKTCRAGIPDKSPADEVGTVSNNDGLKNAPASCAAQQETAGSGVSNDLLRRLKRGCILQYANEDENDEDGDHRDPQQGTGTLFERFKRHVCSRPTPSAKPRFSVHRIYMES